MSFEPVIGLEIHAQLLTETKKYAVATGQSMTAVIEDALRQMLAKPKQLAERPPVPLRAQCAGPVSRPPATP